MDGIHDAGVPACPNCGQGDRVAGVPAVFLAGRDSVRVAVPAHADSPAHTETRQVTSGLAQALAPVPAPRASGAGCLLGGLAPLVLVASTAALVVDLIAPPPDADPTSAVPVDPVLPPGYSPAAGSNPSPWPDLSWLGWVAGVGYAVGILLVVLLLARRIGFRQKLAGRARAEELWARGWYCARCGTAHFRSEPGAPSRPLSLGEFRRLVWSAGGYGDLAVRYPIT
ncbi:hypothetical protein [Streptacidiphilus rugosus]|uniref:hypothetical protein n=1 Tax=Streptacidiphilus rugosus TaxID=405783 RepID=UPI00068C1F2D|nr:hypothetical protein [Streptacidiphilus rugosus]